MRNLQQLGIVVPTLNAAKTLRSTLEALRDAVSLGARVIVADGHSTDATLGIAKEYQVEVIRQSGNMYEAINAGLGQIDREWCTWINADDLLYCDRLVVRLSDASTVADVNYGIVDFIDEQGRFMHCWRSARPKSLERLYRAGYSPLLQQGTLFRREVFESLGGFRCAYRYVADADFWWRALERGFSFAFHDGPPVAAFRLHPTQQSRCRAEEMRAEHKAMGADHGVNPGCWTGFCDMMQYRWSNRVNYLVRFLRRANLSLSIGFADSYGLSSAVDSVAGRR